MGKIKIHEIAKELGVESKEIIASAQKLGIEVTSHLSRVEDEVAQKIRNSFLKQENLNKENSKQENSNKENVKKENAKQEGSKKEDSKLNKKEEKEKKGMEKEKKQEKNSKKESSPVIIRRQVIVADEEKEDLKQEKENRKDVGFVERKKNQDFNIVYRKQPVKPKTVSELFGIKTNQKEEKKEENVVKEQTETVTEPMANTSENTAKEQTQKVAEEKVTTKPEKSETPTSASEKVNEEPKSTYNKLENNYQNRANNNQEGNKNKYSNHQGENNQNYFKNRQNGDNQNKYNNNRQGENGQNRYGNRQGENGQNRYGNRQGENGQKRYGNRNGEGGQRQFNKNNRPLDNRGIDRNIKDIMASEIIEKEDKRDISTRAIDKEKANRYEDNKAKKGTKAKKGDRFSEDFNEGKLKDLKQVDSLSHMFNEQDGGMLDYYDLTTARGKKNKRKFQKEEERTKQKIFELKEITIPETITVKDLAAEMKKTSGEVIKKLFNYGIMATINNTIDFDTAFLVAGEFGITANKKEEVKEEDILFDDTEDTAEELEPRPPVVVVMGHVDHGKTSLLDAIRSTNVIEGEAGGITQHIGAYKVNINNREITFLDTPGHEAFTAMRARGAQITDVAILVVAADDGVMPQTVEAINHAKAAEVPIIVAVNKIDLPGANVEKIKQELMEYELVPEEWGGDTIYVPISAKKKINIDNLLEMVLLVADMKELKANPHKQAKGTVIEARLDKAKGPIASILVQRGTLDEGDTIVVGKSIGRIRAMKNDKGQKVKKAGPSTPVEVMGLTEVPEAGDTFYEVKDEKMAKHLIERRKRQEREQAMAESNKVTLSNLFEKMESENLKQLNIIVKADVQGTAQALKQSLEKLSNDEVKVKVIHAVAGAVTESDVQLAKAGNCIIIAFNVRPVNTAKDMAEKENVEIKQYSVIYQALEDVEAAMKGMLEPVYEEKIIGNAVVRQTFKVSNVGTVAGAYVLEGKIERNAGVRVIRENVVIHDGKLISLKRFKDDAKEVSKGFECGLQIEGYNDVKEDDTLEFYVMEQVR